MPFPPDKPNPYWEAYSRLLRGGKLERGKFVAISRDGNAIAHARYRWWLRRLLKRRGYKERDVYIERVPTVEEEREKHANVSTKLRMRGVGSG